MRVVVYSFKDPLDSGVITCGTINGGHGVSIIADRVTIEGSNHDQYFIIMFLQGTCRSFTKNTKAVMKSRMCEACCGVARTFGGEVDLDYEGQLVLILI